TSCDIRGTIFELSRTEDSADLRAQIRDITANARPTLGLRPDLVLDGPLDSAVPDSLKPHLIAVLVESLSNAARHASPTKVDIRVAIEGVGAEARVVAEVRDDGKGFSTPVTRAACGTCGSEQRSREVRSSSSRLRARVPSSGGPSR
ncbi:MAG: hypothetical protein WKF54_12610, partial [Nocardioidaceae bacterium]